jgi:hypothetical protein
VHVDHVSPCVVQCAGQGRHCPLAWPGPEIRARGACGGATDAGLDQPDQREIDSDVFFSIRLAPGGRGAPCSV